MHRRFFSCIIAFLLYIPFQYSFGAPQQEESSWDRGTIESQFNYLNEKSSRYEDFRVIKQTSFNALKAHVADTMKSMRKQIHELQQQVNARRIQIDSMRTNLQNTSSSLSDVSRQKNSISFLGINMGKHVYNTFTWTIIAGLLLCLIVVILLFKRSNMITTQTKINLVETKEEFEAFRKRALEREGQMARKHLDEMNKYKK